MAIPKVKSTYSLDLETTADLEALAARWNVSKSEVIRRAIRAAAHASTEEPSVSLIALDRLQEKLKLNKSAAKRWEAESKRERHASSS